MISVGRSRQEQRQKAQDHLAAGNTAAAWECYAKCVDVTPQMAWHFIQAQCTPFRLTLPTAAASYQAHKLLEGDATAILLLISAVDFR